MFNVSSEIASQWANLAVDDLLKSHIKLPYYWIGADQDNQRGTISEFARAIFDGKQLRQKHMQAILDIEHSLDTFNLDQETALHWSVERSELVSQLIDAGVILDRGNAFGKTPLMYAAHFDLYESAALLLANKAQLEAETRKLWGCEYTIEIGNRTALMYAAENASQSLIDLFVRFGANVEAKDTGHRSVYDYLRLNPQDVTLKSLQELGPNFDCSKVQRDIELAICASAGASLADLKLKTAFSSAIQNHGEEMKSELRSSQRAWIKMRDQKCGAKESSKDRHLFEMGSCLASETQKRVEYLNTSH
jgi:uncharacterized protein YecT (DUF1311 family)